MHYLFNSHNSKERTHLTLLRGVCQQSRPRKRSFSEGNVGSAFQILPRKGDVLANRPTDWQGRTYCGHACSRLWAGDREQGNSATSACSNSVLLNILPNTDGPPMLVCLMWDRRCWPCQDEDLQVDFSLQISQALCLLSGILGEWERDLCCRTDETWFRVSARPGAGILCFLLLL